MPRSKETHRILSHAFLCVLFIIIVINVNPLFKRLYWNAYTQFAVNVGRTKIDFSYFACFVASEKTLIEQRNAFKRCVNLSQSHRRLCDFVVRRHKSLSLCLLKWFLFYLLIYHFVLFRRVLFATRCRDWVRSTVTNWRIFWSFVHIWWRKPRSLDETQHIDRSRHHNSQSAVRSLH